MNSINRLTSSISTSENLTEIEPHVVLGPTDRDEVFQVKGHENLLYSVRKLSNGDTLYGLDGRIEEPLDAVIEIEADSVLFLYCRTGSSLFSCGGENFACVPEMYLAVPGPAKYVTRYGRGLHCRRGFVTSRVNIAGSMEWVRATDILRNDRFFHETTSAHVQEITEVSLRIEKPQDVNYSDVIRYYSLCSAILGSQEAGIQNYVAGFSKDSGCPFVQLLHAIDADHTGDWSLARGALHCGYSVFHFSRVFRTAMGIGFPDFVTKIRAHKSLNHMLGSTLPPQQVAEQNGFATASGMREALRQYFGFTSTDIRTFKQLDFERMTA